MKPFLILSWCIIACTSEPLPPKITAPYSALSVNEGKVLYDFYCQSCHGKEGKGDGLNAFTLSPPPSDLTLTKTTSKTDEQLKIIIGKGSDINKKAGAMPPYGLTLKDYQIKDIVSYIRKLAK